MTTLQELALELYDSTDFTDQITAGQYKHIATACVDMAAEFLIATTAKQAEFDRQDQGRSLAGTNV